MTGAAKVTTSVIDLTNRVQPVGTYSSAIVIAAKIGPVNTPVRVTGQTDFLRKFTIDETIEIGWDNAYIEAWQFLKTQPNLYVVRAAHTEGEARCLYGGCKIRTMNSAFDNAPMINGFAVEQSAADEVPFIEQNIESRPYYPLPANAETYIDPVTGIEYYNVNGEDRQVIQLNDEKVVFETEDDTAVVIYSASEGDYANRIAIQIINDPDIVKLDGCFIIRVYKKSKSNQYFKVEEHLCSLDPTLKNGYGVSCYITNVLGASKYIRALVNPFDYIVKGVSYKVAIKGTVELSNPYIYTNKTFVNNAIHEVGDVIKRTDITNKTAFYECSIAGQSDSTTTRSIWVTGTNYNNKVVEGSVTWRLKEVILPYVLSSSYKLADVIEAPSGDFYKAMNAGNSGLTSPDNWGADTVEDGDIVWTKQKQEVIVYEKTAYTNCTKESGALPDSYPAYIDEYLSKAITLPKSFNITDTTTVDPVYGTHAQKTYSNVVYSKLLTGEATGEHYVLPKPSKVVNGSFELIKLNGGFDGSIVETGDRIKALDSLKSMANYQFELVQDGGQTTPTYASALFDLCQKRKEETHAIISTPIDYELGRISGYSVTDIITYKKEALSNASKLMELYTTHQLVYDEFNDRNVYASPSCFMAANILKYARELGWHWAVAGYKRGAINSLDVLCTFDEDELDQLADNQINAIIKEPGEGIVAWDEQTLYPIASDLQEAHIARYVDLYLRPTLKSYLKGYLFEFNDEETRRNVTQRLTIFMEKEKGARAVYEYKIICDETNNTGADIEANIMNCWLLIKATKISKYINQSIILTPYSLDFGEAVELI